MLTFFFYKKMAALALYNSNPPAQASFVRPRTPRPASQSWGSNSGPPKSGPYWGKWAKAAKGGRGPGFEAMASKSGPYWAEWAKAANGGSRTRA